MIRRVAARYLMRLLKEAKKFYPRGPGKKWYRRKQKGRKKTLYRRYYRINKKKILRQQVKYRRRGVAKMKRRRWLRKFKRNPNKYRYRRGSVEMQTRQMIERVALQFIRKRKRKHQDKLRDRQRYKKHRSQIKQKRKLYRKKPAVKRRTKKVRKHREKNPQLHKMRYASIQEMAMERDLRNKLIRLAHAKPELRGDLLPLLKQASEELHKDVSALIREAPSELSKSILIQLKRRKIRLYPTFDIKISVDKTYLNPSAYERGDAVGANFFKGYPHILLTYNVEVKLPKMNKPIAVPPLKVAVVNEYNPHALVYDAESRSWEEYQGDGFYLVLARDFCDTLIPHLQDGCLEACGLPKIR